MDNDDGAVHLDLGMYGESADDSDEPSMMTSHSVLSTHDGALITAAGSSTSSSTSTSGDGHLAATTTPASAIPHHLVVDIEPRGGLRGLHSANSSSSSIRSFGSGHDPLARSSPLIAESVIVPVEDGDTDSSSSEGGSKRDSGFAAARSRSSSGSSCSYRSAADGGRGEGGVSSDSDAEAALGGDLCRPLSQPVDHVTLDFLAGGGQEQGQEQKEPAQNQLSRASVRAHTNAHASARDQRQRSVASMSSNSSLNDVASAVSETPSMMQVDCEVCLGTVRLRDLVHLPCKHAFCADCIRQHITTSIAVGRIPASCPNSSCPEFVPVDIVHRVCDKTFYQQYRRFVLLREDKRISECPFCSNLQQADPSAGPDVFCSKCGGEYCFFHGAAHPGQSCEGFENRSATENELSEIAIKELSKPCPSCQRPVELAGGCTHVKCPGCHTDFCFKCGQAQLEGTFVLVCKVCQEQYLEHRYLPLWAVLWVLLLPIWVAYVAVSLVIVVLCGPCVCASKMPPSVVLAGVFLPCVVAGDVLFQLMDWTCPCSGCPCSEGADEEADLQV